MGGGVPELTPVRSICYGHKEADTKVPHEQFIRYLSMYMDMEWKAIQTNDKGKGVVLAATWVGLDPRRFDTS